MSIVIDIIDVTDQENIIGDGSYLCGMQSSELKWLTHAVVNQSEIARRLGISGTLFSNKLKGNQYKRFNENELTRLKQIREDILKELNDSTQ